MTLKIVIAAFAMLLGATTVSLAQSMPNFGPNAPATGDSFGQPPSGTHPPRSGYRAYAYQQQAASLASSALASPAAVRIVRRLMMLLAEIREPAAYG